MSDRRCTCERPTPAINEDRTPYCLDCGRELRSPNGGPDREELERMAKVGITLARQVGKAVVTQRRPPEPARLALTKPEAARSLGISVDFLEGHVLHELRVIRRGRRVLIPVSEIERWLDESAALTLDER